MSDAQSENKVIAYSQACVPSLRFYFIFIGMGTQSMPQELTVAPRRCPQKTEKERDESGFLRVF